MKPHVAIIAAAAVLNTAVLFADELGNGLRGPAPLDQEAKAPPIANVENFDIPLEAAG